MGDLNLSIDKLISESPVSEATRHHDKTHISEIVNEDVREAKSAGILHTDKHYRTHRIEEAAIRSIRDRLGRWAEKRNDLIKKTDSFIKEQSSSKFDIEMRQLNEKMEHDQSQARKEFMDGKYEILKTEFEGAENNYKKMKAELGDKPPVTSRIWLYGFTILMIGFIEWFINYSTFSAKYPPGIAFGATVLIALSIALASHFHGGLLKQRLALFAKDKDISKKRHVILIQVFFSLLLIIALVIVTYNRYDILRESIVQLGAIGLPGMEEKESVMGLLIPFILLNILVWIVGVAISYFTHDAQPGYQEAHAAYVNKSSKFYKADKKLQDELSRIEHEYKAKIDKVTNSISSYQEEKTRLLNSRERLVEKEKSIINQAMLSINSMLEKHHAMLIAEFRAQEMTNVCIGPDSLNIEQFKERSVAIDKGFVRHALSLEETNVY